MLAEITDYKNLLKEGGMFRLEAFWERLKRETNHQDFCLNQISLFINNKIGG